MTGLSLRRMAPIMCCAAALTAALLIWRPQDIALYNATPSMPVGVYLRRHAPIVRGAVVTVRARDVAAAYAKLRAFDDDGDRFLKRVVGVAGDEVCASDDIITLNGALVATRSAADRAGRPLPSWSGCRRLEQDDFFLLGDTPDSFDSRYWGPVTRSQIEGVWRKL